MRCSISRSTVSSGDATSESQDRRSHQVAGFVHARSSFSRRPADPFSSSFSNPLAAVFWHGSNAAAARSTTSSFQAGSIMPITSARGNMRDSSTSGSTGSDFAGRITGRIRFAEPRHRSSISRQVTCARCRYCSAIQRSKAPFVISASTLRMRSPCPRARRCSAPRNSSIYLPKSSIYPSNCVLRGRAQPRRSRVIVWNAQADIPSEALGRSLSRFVSTSRLLIAERKLACVGRVLVFSVWGRQSNHRE